MIEPRCQTCGDPVAAEGIIEPREGWLCETCWNAYHNGISIEEARAEVEDTAAFWSMRFGRAEGHSCTCGTIDHLAIAMGPRHYVARIHLDVRHEVGCPLGPPEFNWSPVDEDAREALFGYRGRDYHLRRLTRALRDILAEREVMET